MLSINNYPQSYIDECRAKMQLQLSAYKKLLTAIKKQNQSSDKSLDAALAAFETLFFNNLIFVLDNYFCHRSRTVELKDGNPLNEVRMLCNSMMNSSNKMQADKTIKYIPEKSILKYPLGGEIKLTETDFTKLSKAFFAEMENKFV